MTSSYIPNIQTIKEENLKKEIESVSFSGGGFNAYYHFGVVNMLQNNVYINKVYGTETCT